VFVKKIIKNSVYTCVIAILLSIAAYDSQAQVWQESYNKTLEVYYSENYSLALIEGKKALSLASSPLEKLYTLKVLSAICNESNDFDKGIVYSKQEVEICLSQSVADSVYIGSLNNLASNYLGNQKYEEAIPVLSSMVNIGKDIFDKSSLDRNQHLSDLGYAYYMIQNFDSAIFFLSEANTYLLTIDGGAEDYLMNQLTICQAYYQNNNLDLSLNRFQELKILLEANELTEEQLYAETLEGLALVYYTTSDFNNSKDTYEIASSTYSQLGFSINELEDLNSHLALVYLKTEDATKSDSVQALLSNKVSNQNLIINQLSLAHKKFLSGDLVGANNILSKVKDQLDPVNQDLMLAEYILLNTRINLKLNSYASIDSINSCVQIFFHHAKKAKEAEAYLVKSKIYKSQGENSNAITSLVSASQISSSVENSYPLKYNIVLDLLNIYLELNLLSEAKKEYSKISLDKEFGLKLSYTYAILLQINGYNFEAEEVLTKLLEGAKYPKLLEYQRAIAKVYLDLGQTKKSLEMYTIIDSYLENSSQKETVYFGENLAQLGRIHVILGEYNLAEDYYVKGIASLENNTKTLESDLASVYNSYAIFEQTIGNYDRANLFYVKAKQKAVNSPNLQVDIIQNLATLSQSQGNYADAIILLQEAITTYDKIYGQNHPYYATALQNLANAHSKNGDLHKAKSLLENAIDIDKNNGLENSISYINKMHNLGVILQETFEFRKAKETFTVVLEARKEQLGDHHPDYIYTLYNMAVLMQKMEVHSQAKLYFNEVIEKYDYQLKSFFPHLSEEEKSKYYSKINEAFTAYQDFAIEYSAIEPAIASDLYNFQLNHKAILLSSSKLLRNTIINSQDNNLISLYENWVDKKKSLAKYYSVPKKELALVGISIEQMAEEANTIEKELSLKSESFSKTFSEKEKNWQTVQKGLTTNEAAVEIIRLKKNIRSDSVWYAALVIKPELTYPTIVILKNGKELEKKFFNFYVNKIMFKLDDTQSYANYWQAINKELIGISKIYLSSDGIYNKINISTLWNSESNSFVLDELTVHHVTNTIELIEETKPLSFNSNFSLDLIGDPHFSQSKKDNYAISPLPSTRIEINTIDSLARTKNIHSILLVGKGASEVNIKKIESPSVIHIATHGFFLADKTQFEDVYSIGNNPLMRSGLLFSGAGKSFRGDRISFKGSINDEDGILTALEVLNINLSNTELVVLSACETALGEVKNGEGVYGLQRAFVIAGAKSILMSLWKVDDQTTKELMILYYQNLLDGENKFEALTNAQKKLKEKHNNPYYWGAFIISGI
jgi:CHAT domain-containing protein/Flp pilus assembly protein TadD